MTRAQANLEILTLLATFLRDNPDQRFGQALMNTGILRYDEDDLGFDAPIRFHPLEIFTESEVTLNRVKEMMRDWL